MNKLSNISAQTWIIIFLVIINLGTLGFMLSNKPLVPFTERPLQNQKDRAHRYMQNKLNFNEEQNTLFREYQQEHFRFMTQTRNEIIIKKHELYEILPNDENAQELIEQKAKELGILYSTQELSTYKHINKIKGVCKPEQLEDMQIMMNRMIFQSDHQQPRRRMNNSQNNNNRRFNN